MSKSTNRPVRLPLIDESAPVTEVALDPSVLLLGMRESTGLSSAHTKGTSFLSCNGSAGLGTCVVSLLLPMLVVVPTRLVVPLTVILTAPVLVLTALAMRGPQGHLGR